MLHQTAEGDSDLVPSDVESEEFQVKAPAGGGMRPFLKRLSACRRNKITFDMALVIKGRDSQECS